MSDYYIFLIKTTTRISPYIDLRVLSSYQFEYITHSKPSKINIKIKNHNKKKNKKISIQYIYLSIYLISTIIMTIPQRSSKKKKTRKNIR